MSGTRVAVGVKKRSGEMKVPVVFLSHIASTSKKYAMFQSHCHLLKILLGVRDRDDI